MAERYSILEKASLDQHFLKSNSTCLNIFDAIAEIVDNSRDARAKNFFINEVKCQDTFGEWYVCFQDDGEGMEPSECEDVIKFGKSKKRLSLEEYVGRNGVGLKSSTFRLSKDFILFTKKNDHYSIVFWSQSFYKQYNCSDVIVALPSFKNDRQPYYNPKRYNINTENEIKKHELELELIFNYSPFKSVDALFEQFSKIAAKSGTLIVCYNLWLNNDGQTEFIIDENKDLVLTGDDRNDIRDLPLERRSFREYISILYTDPKMKIYINGSKARTKKLFYHLYLPYEYEFIAKNMFKRKGEIDLLNIKNELEDAKLRLREAHTNERDHSKRVNILSKTDTVKQRLLQEEKLKWEHVVKEKAKEIEAVEKNRREAQLITIRFGVNVQNPKQNGFYIYNGVRLITTPDKLNKQFEKTYESRGIVGIVIIPYSVMEPAQYKSEGLRTGIEKEIIRLKKVLDDHLDQYLRDLKNDIRHELEDVDSIDALWELFGYDSKTPDLLPLIPKSPQEQQGFYRQRAARARYLLQCDICLKWRVVPTDKEFNSLKFPDNWQCCNFNHVVRGISCEMHERYDIRIKKGELKKETRAPVRPADDRRYSVSTLNASNTTNRSQIRASVGIEAVRNPMSLFSNSRNSGVTQNSRIEITQNSSILQRTLISSLPNDSLKSQFATPTAPSTSNQAQSITTPFTSNLELADDSSSDFDNEPLFTDTTNLPQTSSSSKSDLTNKLKKKRPRNDDVDRTYQPPAHLRRLIQEDRSDSSSTENATARLPIMVNHQNGHTSSEPEVVTEFDEVPADTNFAIRPSLIFPKASSSQNPSTSQAAMAENCPTREQFDKLINNVKFIINEIKGDDQDITNFTTEDICNYNVEEEFSRFLTDISEKFRRRIREKNAEIENKEIIIQNLKKKIGKQ